MNSLLKELNDEQRLAVTSSDGPQLIVAGSGTGKTRVITTKIAYLLDINPNLTTSEMLAITFTKKAADEMLERLGGTIKNVSELWVSTFHAFSHRLLRDHAIDIGLAADFRLLDDVELRLFFKKILDKEIDLKYYAAKSNDSSFIEAVIKFISRLKDEMVDAESLEKFAKKIKDKEEREKYLELSVIYSVYEKAKLRENVADFGDLILKNLRLFKERPSILKKYQKQFKYILVDEFQDTNIAQIELVSMLAEKHRNICVVGDDDQAIYRFRGASFASFLVFKDKFPELKTVKLTENYRSTKNILDIAGTLIKHNDVDRFDPDKGLWTKNPSGEKVKIFISDDYSTEAKVVSEKIKDLYKLNGSYGTTAVLYRAHNHKDEIIRFFKKNDIPYEIYGGSALFESYKIKELVSYLRAIGDPSDSPNLHNLMEDSIFDTKKDDLIKLSKYSSFNNITLYEALEKSAQAGLSLESQNRVTNFKKTFQDLMDLSKKTSLDDFTYEVAMARTMILRELFINYDKAKEREVKALGAFFKLVREFTLNREEADLRLFLEYIKAYLEAKETIDLNVIDYAKDSVKVMTVHQAKGLEFENVFVIGLVQNKFPTLSRAEQIPFPLELIKERLPKGNFHTEEERRLFYVAITRAKKRLYLSGVVKPYHKKSVFLDEVGDSAEIKEFKKPCEAEEDIFSDNDIKSIQFQKNISSLLGSFDYKDKEAQEKAKKKLAEEFDDFILKSLELTGEQAIDKASFILPPEAVFSYTQLDTYLNCPLKYKFSYLDFIPRRPKPHLIFGDVIHKALKDFYTTIQKNEEISEKILLNLFEGFWSGRGYRTKKEEELKKKEGAMLLRNFFKKNKGSFKPPLFLEKKFMLKISDYIIKGFIDRIDNLPDGKVMVIDYKTGKKINKPSLQLDIYAIACTEEFGLEIGSLAYYYIVDNELVEVKRSYEDIEKTKDKIVRILSDIKRGLFAPKPSRFACSGCDYQLICPSFK